MRPGIEDVVFGYLRFPSGRAAHLHLSWLDPHKERRFTVVGSKRMATFDDMDIERKVTVYDKGFDEDSGSYGEYITRTGGHLEPADPEPRAAADRVRALRRVHPRGPRSRSPTARAGCAWCGCSRGSRRGSTRPGGSSVQPSDLAPGLFLGDGVQLAEGVQLGAHVVIHPGTVVGDGCVIQDHAVLGKPPKLARHSSAPREAPAPLVLGRAPSSAAGRSCSPARSWATR